MLVSSDSASLVEKKQEPVVMNIKKVISRRLLKTDKTHDSLGHAYPARQSPSASKILASSCLTLIDELITYLMTVKHDCQF